MLETGDALATWALAELPADWQTLLDDSQLKFASSNSVDAERLPEHRLAYLDYEGPVSSGRGSVRRLDTGNFMMTNDPNVYVIEGEFLRGTILLQPPTENSERWRLTFTAQRVP